MSSTEVSVENTTQIFGDSLPGDVVIGDVVEEITTEKETTTELVTTTEAETTTEKETTTSESNVIGDRPVERRVYITPKGQRYHYDAECGGKNSYEVTMDEVGSRTACQKCAK